MATLGSLNVKIGANLDNLKKGLSKTSKLVKGAAKNIGKGLALGAGGGAILLGSAIGQVSIESFSMATDMQAATAQIQAALGVTADQAEQLGKIGQDVFTNNFTGSIGEATAAVGLTAQQLKNITFDELQAATQNALKLSDAFGVDLSTTLNAANVLMGQFGLSQQQAFDFLSSGFQKGLDTSGDFLDSVTEYGNLFSNAGANAGQFFSIMETGLQGGVLGTDKVADAFKEFQIRFLEGHKDFGPALETLGIDYAKLFSQVDSGAITMADAFGLVTLALKETDLSSLDNQAAVAALGTQFEDLGAEAVSGISTVSSSISDLEGSTATLDAQYDTLSAKFATIQRQAGTALAPIGEQMLAMAESALPTVSSLAETLTTSVLPAVTQAFDAMKLGFAFFQENDTFGRIGQAFVDIGTSLGLIEEGTEPAGLALEAFEALLGTIETGVKAGVLVIEGIALAMEAIASATDSVVTAVNNFKEGLASITYPAVLDQISAGIGSIGSWWSDDDGGINNATAQSPAPFAVGLKQIGQAARSMPDISSKFGDVANSLNNQGRPAGNNDSMSDSDRPIVIHLQLDGKTIATAVTGIQGEQRHDRALLGGATAL